MSFPRYPEYKPSNVEWLGDVPKQWETCALKRIIRLQSGETITAERIEEEGAYPVFGGNGIRGFTAEFTHDGEFVLIGRQGALCGNINYGRGKFWASEHAVVASPIKPVATKWLGEMLRTMNLNQYSVSAAQPGLSVELVERLWSVIPPLSDQLAIATFLDRETSKIDALVAEQRRLMDLLKEKRQAVISHAVTKGLNPNAPMKPSGIEWLGEVPAHWQVIRLEHVCEFVWGKAHEAFVEDEGAHLCVTARFVSTGGNSRRMCTENFTPAKQGDILMVMSDLPNGRALARAYLIRDQRSYAVNQRVCGIRVRDGDSRYFAYQLDRNPELLSQDDGSNQTHLSNHDFTKLRVVAPPRAEQSAIADKIDAKLAAFDALSDSAARAIELLQERRTELISAAVTGQIDVRDLADTEAA